MNVVLEVKGMSCSHCEKSVKDGLTNLKGVNCVQVHLNEGKVDVHYDKNEVSLDEICSTIEDLGYDVNR